MCVIIVTNNNYVLGFANNCIEVKLFECDYINLLKVVRDYIHKGHILLSHPLSGSLKPNENPYKSIMISAKVENIDEFSVSLIELAIQTASKFVFKDIMYSDKVKNDFKFIDKCLIESAIISNK